MAHATARKSEPQQRRGHGHALQKSKPYQGRPRSHAPHAERLTREQEAQLKEARSRMAAEGVIRQR